MVSPRIRHEKVDPLAVTQFCPALVVTVYWVMAEPPVLVGAVHDTSDLLSELDVAVTEVGVPGEAAGTMGAEGVEAGPVPRALVAVTVNV